MVPMDDTLDPATNTTGASATSEGASESGDLSTTDEGTTLPVDTLDPASSSSETTLPDPTAAEESSSDDGSASECPIEDVCADAVNIGTVSGDEPSASIEVSGDASGWLTFRVIEDDHTLSGEALSFTATLTSPLGVDFDLYVYRGPAEGRSGCDGVMESSTAAVGDDVVHMSWGEGAMANAIADDAWIAVEIIPKGDMCPDGDDWSLTVEGDT